MRGAQRRPRERAKITDWIQAGVIVLAAVVACFELYFSSDASELEKARNTVELLRDGYDPAVLDAVEFLARGEASANATTSSATEMLVRLTPLNEYLLAFAVCYDSGLCLEAETLQHLCGRMTTYEARVPSFFDRFGLTFDPVARPLRETAAWRDCSERETT